MQNTLIIVFTQRVAPIKGAYLNSLGLLGSPRFQDENCKVAVVRYPSGGQCVTPDARPSDVDILLVQDEAISDDTRGILRHYINESERVVVTYHQGAGESLSKKEEEGGHREVIRSLCENKEVCSTEEHSSSGNTFDALTKVAEAISESDRSKYDNAIEQIVDSNCRGLVLESKLDLLHELLVPPAEDSGEWSDIEEDEWERLMGLVEDDSEESEYKEKYEEAWNDFINADPHQYSEDPFDEAYCGSENKEGILEELRDGLLSTAP